MIVPLSSGLAPVGRKTGNEGTWKCGPGAAAQVKAVGGPTGEDADFIGGFDQAVEKGVAQGR